MLDTILTLAAADPASHVYNHYGYKSAGGWWLWSGNQGNLLLSAVILIFGMKWVASNIATGPESDGNRRYVTRNPLAHMIEVICVYLRDEVARPLLHDRTRRLIPFLWTIFFFILVNNLLGLVPLLDIQHIFARLAGEAEPHWALVGGTSTQNIWVTGVLAVLAGIFFNLEAIRRLGIGGYFGHMTAGAPFYVAWLIFILELAGQILIKPTALAVRLFANMTAGHILLATLFSFAGAVWGKGLLLQGPVTVVSVVGGTAIMFLELFVAFLQAFVFMFLTTVFISLMDHHGHEEGHGDAHAHGVPAH
jgi:F-type H+-transporting ATPase subunit a